MLYMKAKSILIIIVFGLVYFIGTGCGSSRPVAQMTPEMRAVQIIEGNQNTTLNLTKDHVPISTTNVQSEFQARQIAVSYGADVVQTILVSSYNGGTTSLTVRFWKRK